MAKSSQQKLKILYLMKAFVERTDENHPLTVKDIVKLLEEYGIVIERKTVYDDIETLKVFGMDIISKRHRPTGYYLGSRTFELPELKLLVDAVQSSKFTTVKKSQELIKKLESLTSIHEAKSLERQVFVHNSVKAWNEGVYYNINEIHTAISENKQITFQYFEWNLEKEMCLKKEGARYRVSPWGMIWKDDNYYLIAIDEKSGIVKHYRVDKMLKICVEEESRNGASLFSDFNAAQFAIKTFGMFGGREEKLTMEFENHFIGVVIDRFGKEVSILKKDEEHFNVVLSVNISSQFFAWVAGLGSGVKIISPEKVQNEYIRFLKKALDVYKEK